MEDLILETATKKIIVGVFDDDNEIPFDVYPKQPVGGATSFTYLTPSQTRELIEHLTNCLKEVEGERPLPDTTFKLKSPFGK